MNKYKENKTQMSMMMKILFNKKIKLNTNKFMNHL